VRGFKNERQQLIVPGEVIEKQSPRQYSFMLKLAAAGAHKNTDKAESWLSDATGILQSKTQRNP
jgi:hypothetical protein